MKMWLLFILCLMAGNLHALSIYNYHTNEVVDLHKKDPKTKVRHIFRSRSDDKEIDINENLISLLDNIQNHFKADVIELISGYRSPELNRRLKESGANVAEESLHMEGKAADIHIDEVTEEAIAEYARGLKLGGVGYYPAWDFVHVDVGDVRNWDLPDKPGRLLMAFRKGDRWQVLTDKDIYFLDEQVPYEVLNITRTAKDFNDSLKLQIFRRGVWQDVRVLTGCDGKKLKSGMACEDIVKWGKDDQFGKYRIVISGNSLEVRSNEFYRKRR